MGENAKYIIADLTREDGIESIVDNCPKLNGVVHCAGIGHRKMGKQITGDDVDTVMNINFKCKFTVKAVL